MADLNELASALFGTKRVEGAAKVHEVDVIYGQAVEDSSDGTVKVVLEGNVTQPEDLSEEIEGAEVPSNVVDIPTGPHVEAGDDVVVQISGGRLKAPLVTGVVGGGDRMQGKINESLTAAKAAETAAEEAARIVGEVDNHFWVDTDGVHVTRATQEEFKTNPTGANLLENSQGILLRDGTTPLSQMSPGAFAIYDGAGDTASNVVASFTANSATIGKAAAGHVTVDTDSLDVCDGSQVLATFTDNAISLGANSTTSEVSFCGGEGRLSYDASLSKMTFASNNFEFTATDENAAAVNLYIARTDEGGEEGVPHVAGDGYASVQVTSQIEDISYPRRFSVDLDTMYSNADTQETSGARLSLGSAGYLEASATGNINLTSGTSVVPGGNLWQLRQTGETTTPSYIRTDLGFVAGYIGANPVTSTSSDMPSYWKNNIRPGHALYNTSGMLNHQPSQYGVLVSAPSESSEDVFQLWGHGSAGIWARAGWGSSWQTPWQRIGNAWTSIATSTGTTSKTFNNLSTSSYNDVCITCKYDGKLFTATVPVVALTTSTQEVWLTGGKGTSSTANGHAARVLCNLSLTSFAGVVATNSATDRTSAAAWTVYAR